MQDLALKEISRAIYRIHEGMRVIRLHLEGSEDRMDRLTLREIEREVFPAIKTLRQRLDIPYHWMDGIED